MHSHIPDFECDYFIMKFGKVSDTETVDFSLPNDQPATGIFCKQTALKNDKLYVGCAKWNKSDLKNFYPRGTKDELSYYSTQFNSIEFNGSFYRIYGRDQFEKWKNKTPEEFRFFPKVSRDISHIKRLN